MSGGFFQGVHIVEGLTKKQGDFLSGSDLYFICRVGHVGSHWEEKGLEVRSKVIKGQRVKWDAKFCYHANRNPKTPLEMTIRLMDRDHFTKDDMLDSVTLQVPQKDTVMNVPPEKFAEKASEVKIEFFRKGKWEILALPVLRTGYL